MLNFSKDFKIVFCFLVKPQNGFTFVRVNSYWIPIVRTFDCIDMFFSNSQPNYQK